jgi:protein TonB
MVTRSGSFLVSSLAVHGVLFAALASSPPPVDPAPALRVIEFVTITDEGGGRIGNDDQIGDAVEPKEPPEQLFRKVRPKPKPVTRAPAKPKPAVTPPEPSPTDAGEAVADATGSTEASGPTSPSMVSGSAGSDPNATRSGTGSGGEGVDRRSALRAWLSEVQREVNKIASRNYPSSAVRRRLEGRLRLGVTIGPDGRIVSVRVLSSSGHDVLDDSATASVTTLHIPPPPQALNWREREISLPIRYALD